MFEVVLVAPEIPPNTGNIIRLCANTGSHLHLIEPLGFAMDDVRLRRAGLDYHEWATVKKYAQFEQFLDDFPERRKFAITTHGKSYYHQISYEIGDCLVFGSETKGLPAAVIKQIPVAQQLRIPMQKGSRSLNLSNSAALVVYEAWRQNQFQQGL